MRRVEAPAAGPNVVVEAFRDPVVPARGEAQGDIDRGEDDAVDLFRTAIVSLERMEGASHGRGHITVLLEAFDTGGSDTGSVLPAGAADCEPHHCPPIFPALP